MSDFVFTEKKILDSPLQPGAPNSVYFTTNTEKKYFQRKITTLAPGSNVKVLGSFLGGAIIWEDNAFEIGGVRKKKKEIKQSVGGICNSTQQWQWSGRPYIVKYHKKQWTASFGGYLMNAYHYRSR